MSDDGIYARLNQAGMALPETVREVCAISARALRAAHASLPNDVRDLLGDEDDSLLETADRLDILAAPITVEYPS